ncbi:MAG: ABC transporter ATP-binding protein [Clostridiales bacterium]|nr:ABC transporter ATP-binding protein [Clostridiales bacterium]
MKRLFYYISKNKTLLMLSILSAVVSVIASLVGPIIIGKAIDYMMGKNKVNFAIIIKLIIILAVVYIVYSVFSWLLTYATNKIAYKVAEDIRNSMFKKINKLPLRFFDNNPHGDTISRFVNDIDAITDGLIQGLATALTGIITIIGSIIFMINISKVMTLIVLLSAPITYFVARFITKSSQKYFKVQAEKVGILNGYIEEIITGQKTVKAFSYENISINNFKNINNDLYRAGVKSQFFGSLANPSTRLVNNIAYTIVGISGSLISILGKITVGDISSFLIYSNLFTKPFNEISGVYTQIQSASASSKRIFEILDLQEEEEDDNKLSLENVQGEVEFKDVSFSYIPEKKLIKNFNLKIPKGSKVAIVGKTGCGKTTMVNLLMRFYEINSGSINIDGINIKDISRDSLRKNFGMVLQDTFLFTDTIAKNIAYGKKDATLEEIIKAAKETGAHSFIRRLPKGYDTVISGNGDELSVGQKQLLTITRVMLVNPPILILDEATSNIDTRTELNIQKAFNKIMIGKTSFIIAHRLSTIKDADIILVMDSGNVVEQGTHEELLKKKGYYEKLYNSQF